MAAERRLLLLLPKSSRKIVEGRRHSSPYTHSLALSLSPSTSHLVTAAVRFHWLSAVGQARLRHQPPLSLSVSVSSSLFASHASSIECSVQTTKRTKEVGEEGEGERGKKGAINRAAVPGSECLWQQPSRKTMPSKKDGAPMHWWILHDSDM